MKVDAKIVPNKKKFELQFTIILTDVEKATINKSGLRQFVIIKRPTEMDVDHPIWPWVDGTVRSNGSATRSTLIEAQATLQELKTNLTDLKKAMDTTTNAPTEDSFEL